MKDNSSTHESLMAIDAYKITDHDINDLYKKYKKHSSVFSKLFKYTFNTNKSALNQIIIAEDHLQWIGTIIDKKPIEYTLFNIQTFDNLLEHEISMVGEEELFKEIDFKKLLNTSTICTYKDFGDKLDRPQYFIVKITYNCEGGDYIGGDYYCEMELDIIGYLNNKYDKIKI